MLKLLFADAELAKSLSLASVLFYQLQQLSKEADVKAQVRALVGEIL